MNMDTQKVAQSFFFFAQVARQPPRNQNWKSARSIWSLSPSNSETNGISVKTTLRKNINPADGKGKESEGE